MNKYLFIFLVLFVFIVNVVVFASGGVNATSGAMSGITNSDVNNTMRMVVFFFVLLLVAGLLYLVYKFFKKKSIGDILIYIIFFVIILIIAAMAMPNFKTDVGRGANKWQKACYSNIRVVQGAVEMYNMDAPLATGSKNIHLFMDKMNMQNLVKGGYLKPGIKCPGIGEDTYTNVGNLDGDGEVSCGKEGGIGISFSNPKLKYHGTLSGR